MAATSRHQICREPRPRLGNAGASFAAKGCRIDWKVLASAEWRDNRSRLRCGCTTSTVWLSAYQIQEAMTCLKYDADHPPKFFSDTINTGHAAASRDVANSQMFAVVDIAYISTTTK
jgi:hypothetical protein